MLALLVCKLFVMRHVCWLESMPIIDLIISIMMEPSESQMLYPWASAGMSFSLPSRDIIADPIETVSSRSPMWWRVSNGL
jgi:hypothetical protein